MSEQEQMQIKYAPELQEIQAPKFNFEELRLQISASLEKYQKIVVTDDKIPEFKKTKADLNKFKMAIDSERKRVKALYEEPYNAVKPKFDELIKLIDEPVKAIDTQIKNFETKEKEQKKADIKAIYETNIGELKSIVSLDKIYDAQWENKGCSTKKLTKELVGKIEHINSDLRVISGFQSEFETALRTEYLKSLNIVNALDLKQRLEAQKKFQEEQKALEAKKQEQTVEEIKIEMVEAVQETKETIKEALHVITSEKKHHLEFWINASKSKIKALDEFLRANDIEFGIIQKAEKEAITA